MAVHKDCFAYDCDKESCNVLNALYCQNGECSFFKTGVTANAERLASIRRRESIGLPLSDCDLKFLKELGC